MVIEYQSTEYYIILGLTLFVIFMKLLIGGSLGKKILIGKKASNRIKIDLKFGIFLYIFFAMIARIFFTIFDFELTRFDSSLYVQYIWWWKVPMLISQIPIAILLYLMDRDLFNFRLKGILAYIVVAAILLQFFYPVTNKAEFDLVSALTLIVVGGSLMIPIMFFRAGFQFPGIRKDAWRIAFGIIIYSIAAVLLMETILAPLIQIYGNFAQIFVFLLATIFKSIGLILIYFGSTTFKK